MFDTSSALEFSLSQGPMKHIHLQFKHLIEADHEDYSISGMQSGWIQ